jgi:hypothetical protein
MYSASVRGREVFAFAILSSHDVFVAFQSIWAQGFVAAGFAKPQLFFYGIPSVIWILGESIRSSSSPTQTTIALNYGAQARFCKAQISTHVPQPVIIGILLRL